MGTAYDWERDDGPAAVSRPRSVPAVHRAPPPPMPSRHPRPAAPRRRQPRRRFRPFRVLALLVILTAAFIAARTVFNLPSGAQQPESSPAHLDDAPPVSQLTTNNTGDIAVPDWVTENLLPLNEYSRPGDALPQVNGVVVHYVGNPGTTAEQNRSYFAGLAQSGATWASSHFIIGMDGTVIQCVPLDEIAYCSTVRNADTISIECCHPDEEGKFTQETMDSLIKLLNWLIDTYSLERKDVIRHYDVAGKECPIYYVRHPDAWEALLDKLTFPDT